MAFIQLTTFIAAAPQVVFDLSRSISLHKHSMQRFKEKAVAGRTSGLMQEGETVTWQAKRFFKLRTLTVQMKKLQPPYYFIDEATAGDFASMQHEHYFKPCDNGTIMIDQFRYSLRWGKAGVLTGSLLVTPYLQKLLQQRNAYIKKAAEGKGWHQYIV